MKSLLISIRPEWVEKILNGKKTLEIRRTAPKEWVDYLSGKTKEKPKPMTGYIYCTKGGVVIEKDCGLGFPEPINGNVVAKFTLREVERIRHSYLVNTRSYSITSCLTSRHFEEKCCLKQWELDDYLKGKNGYAWHISDLQIFDKPKELSEFKEDFQSWVYDRKPRPPFSWQYVEARE